MASEKSPIEIKYPPVEIENIPHTKSTLSDLLAFLGIKTERSKWSGKPPTLKDLEDITEYLARPLIQDSKKT